MANRIDIIQCHSQKDIKEALHHNLSRYSYLFPKSSEAKILIKPNLNSNMNALTGNTTDLRILSAVIAYFKELDYRHITIGEGTNSGYYRSQISVISRLQVDRLAKHYGVNVKDLNYSDPYSIPFENGISAGVASECVEADLFINLPKLKTHFEAGMSVCLKNLIGTLVGQENKKKAHQSLARNILNINRAIKPHLHIVDGLVAMEGLGPTRGTPIRMDTVVIGTDPYLVDLCCARLAQFDYKKVTTLEIAEKQGLLTPDHHRQVDALDMKGFQRKFKAPKPGLIAGFIHSPKRQQYFLAIRNTPLFTYLASTQWFGKLLFLTGLRQDVFIDDEMKCNALSVDEKKCEKCGICEAICPLGRDPSTNLNDKNRDCLYCLYCYMVCPSGAINFAGKLGFLAEQFRQYDDMIKALYRKKKKH